MREVRGNATRRHVCWLLAVKDSQRGGAQTFFVAVVGEQRRWQWSSEGGAEALGTLVACSVLCHGFELALGGVQGFELLGVFGPLVVGQGLALGRNTGWVG